MIINNLKMKSENIDEHTSDATYIDESVANFNRNDAIIS
jgi:hypothetical protein